MRIEDQLYFAPNILFEDVDFGGGRLPEQFRARIHGFYLGPADACARAGHGFAAGALVLLCVDALARLQTGDKAVGRRFKKFVRENVPSFAGEELAGRLYNDFRNGLIHEGRVKSGAQFSLETGETVKIINGIVLVNPVLLAIEVSSALDRYIDDLQDHADALQRFSDVLVRDHNDDLAMNGAVQSK
jgi:hypothetical protein